MDAVTRLLADLVAIPSVNPMGRPLVGPHYLEGRLTDYLEDWCRTLGVPYERRNVSPGRDNLMAWYRPAQASTTLLFDVHQDTVPVDGMTIDPFAATISDGKMFGRGACDIKGGMAAMLTAFARLLNEKPAGSAAVILACTVDEEFTHTGSSLLAETSLGADMAIVSEPTLLQVVNCHKGAVRWRIRTAGVACHSSTPFLGVNAIYRMAPVIEALAAHASELAGDIPHPILGAPSLSVGRIEGGQSVNIVPDWCAVEIDRRLIPGESPGDAMTRVESALKQRLGRLDEIDFSPPWIKMPALPPENTHGLGWIEIVQRAASRITGSPTEILGVPYGTDAGPLGETGLPCLVFGPGDIAQAHTKDEWVELDQVRMASEAYYEIAVEAGRARR